VGHFVDHHRPHELEFSRTSRQPLAPLVHHEENGAHKRRAVDDDELRRFVECEYPRVVNAVALVCDSRAQAEDAVEEALARAWLRLRSGQSIESLAAWVTRVAMNEARGRVRRRRAEERAGERLAARVAADTRHPEAADPTLGAQREEVRAALRALPRRQREVTVLRYFLGYSTAEIADALHVDPGTVKTSLHRARHTLAVVLGETDDTPKEASCA
jgi:RNA polymerase sigma-70 factor (ECF subfamily)